MDVSNAQKADRDNKSEKGGDTKDSKNVGHIFQHSGLVSNAEVWKFMLNVEADSFEGYCRGETEIVEVLTPEVTVADCIRGLEHFSLHRSLGFRPCPAVFENAALGDFDEMVRR